MSVIRLHSAIENQTRTNYLAPPPLWKVNVLDRLENETNQ
jgi:hypothetical protein